MGPSTNRSEDHKNRIGKYLSLDFSAVRHSLCTSLTSWLTGRLYLIGVKAQAFNMFRYLAFNGLCVVYVRHLITHLGILLYCVTMDARYYVEVNALKSKGTGIQILSTVSENDVHIA